MRSSKLTLATRRGVASLEFALASPILIALTLAGVDAARAFLIWSEVHYAANAIAEAAEKMSVTTDPATGAITTELTAAQIQQAMSIVYAEIPQLNLASGTGLFPTSSASPTNLAVALSSVSYSPLCKAATNCGTQAPFVVWSGYLSVGGNGLYMGYKRSCGTGALTPVPQFSDTNGNKDQMISPVLVNGATPMTLAPQLVADVVVTFVPFFSLLIGTTQIVASATMPAPVGGLDQVVTLNTSGLTGNIQSCS